MTTSETTAQAKAGTPSGMDAIYYLTQDLARARRFYEEALGLQFIRDYMGSFIEADLPDGTTFGLGFIPGGFHPTGGVMFGVPDFEGARERIKASGATVTTEWEGDACTMLWFLDPDGNSSAIHRRKPGRESD